VGGSLLDLFRNGEDGFLFGPFDTLERMFLLSTGSTGNVAANDDPVGLNLDRHSWGGASLTAILAAATELYGAVWTNRSSGSGSSSFSAPTLTLTTVDGSNRGGADTPIATVAGKTYEVDLTYVSGPNGALNIQAYSAAAKGGSNLGSNNGNSPGAKKLIFAAIGTTSYLYVEGAQAGTYTLTPFSVKLVPGNHALQATSTKRPLWKANSGKPYLNFDGTDDTLQTPYIPAAAGTMAVAFKTAGTTTYALGGGGATGNKRVRVGLGTGGRAEFLFNTSTATFDAVDHRNTDLILCQTWGGGVHRTYVDGTLLLEEAVAANMDGVGSAFALGSAEGGGSNFLTGSISAALVRSAISTPGEIAIITNNFRSTFQ